MLARRPFASALTIAWVAAALALALFAVVLPPSLPTIFLHCIAAGSFCLRVLLAACTAGSPLLLLPLLVLIGSSVRHGWREAWRQWRTTRIALDRLAAVGFVPLDRNLGAVCDQLGIAGRVDLAPHPAPFAFCHGLFRPRIRLSTALVQLLGPAELAAVLRHERAHVRRRDPGQLLVARTLAAGLPFLPALRELAETLPLAQELAADRAVLAEQCPRDLARAILLVTRHLEAPVMPLAVGMLGSLEARLDQLAGVPVDLPGVSRSAALRTMLTLACGGLLLIVSIVGARPGGAELRFGMPSLWLCLGFAALASLTLLVVYRQRGANRPSSGYVHS